jgi:hypothetical protein
MATIYSWFSGIDDQLENYYTLLNQELKKRFPEEIKSVKRGDLFEDTSNERYGYRSFGLSIFECINQNIFVIPLSDTPDDYGTIPFQFQVITQFPINYWHSEKNPVVCLGTAPPEIVPGKSYFHNEFVPIDISLFKKEDNVFKLNYNGVLYVIDPYDEEIDQYVSTWQIKAYSESNQLIFGMESESDFESESEPETEESIKLQIAILDIEIEAKIKLRDYLKSKI